VISSQLLVDGLKFGCGFVSKGCHVLIQGSELILEWLEVRVDHLLYLAAESIKNVVLEINMRSSNGAGLGSVLAMFGVVERVCSLRFLCFGRSNGCLGVWEVLFGCCAVQKSSERWCAIGWQVCKLLLRGLGDGLEIGLFLDCVCIIIECGIDWADVSTSRDHMFGF